MISGSKLKTRRPVPRGCEGCVNLHGNQWGYSCRVFTEIQPPAFKKPNGRCSGWRDKNGEIWLRYLLSRYQAIHGNRREDNEDDGHE